MNSSPTNCRVWPFSWTAASAHLRGAQGRHHCVAHGNVERPYWLLTDLCLDRPVADGEHQEVRGLMLHLEVMLHAVEGDLAGKRVHRGKLVQGAQLTFAQGREDLAPPRLDRLHLPEDGGVEHHVGVVALELDGLLPDEAIEPGGVDGVADEAFTAKSSTRYSTGFRISPTTSMLQSASIQDFRASSRWAAWPFSTTAWSMTLKSALNSSPMNCRAWPGRVVRVQVHGAHRLEIDGQGLLGSGGWRNPRPRKRGPDMAEAYSTRSRSAARPPA